MKAKDVAEMADVAPRAADAGFAGEAGARGYDRDALGGFVIDNDGGAVSVTALLERVNGFWVREMLRESIR